MPEDSRSRRATWPRRRRASRDDVPWVSPDAPSAWWSAPVGPPRVVDAASTGAVPQRPAPSPPAPPAPVPQATPPKSEREESLRATAETWIREGGPRRAARGLTGLTGKLIALVALIVVVACGFQGLAWLRTLTAPRPTPLPVQTELDGVITVTNLDPQAPFDGDIQVLAHDGAWYCRNAPLPNSTWHVHLDGGASTTMPCVIPVSTPNTIAPHTFRKAVPSSDGVGLALVDNPAAFQRSTFVPTQGTP